jgi:hypothetical protein
MLAQYDEMRNPADIWGALDNEVKPAIASVVTIAVNPYELVTLPGAVQSVETRLLPSGGRVEDLLDAQPVEKTVWTVGGIVRSSRERLEDVTLTLVERRLTLPVREDGRFVIEGLKSGDYTLEVVVAGGKRRRYRIAVPSPDYTIVLDEDSDG